MRHMLREPTGACTILVVATALLAVDQAALLSQNRPSLEARGTLDTTRVDAGQRVSFSLTITNTSTTSLRNVRVPFVGGSHVSLSAAWWCADPARVRGWSDLRQCEIADTLAPGQGVTVFGTLATSNTIVTAVRAVIEWEAPLVSQTEATLGQLEVTGWPARWARASIPVLQSLAMPLVLAILGAVLQWRLSALEHSRQQHAQKLADERSERENLRAEEAETWRLMLPISHKYTIECYTDLELAAGETVQAMAEARDSAVKPASRSRLDAAFYEWLVFQARVRVVNESGAFYFRDPTGEALVVALLQAFTSGFIYQRPPQGGRSKLSPEDELDIRRRLGRVMELMKPLPNADVVLTNLEAERSAGAGPWLRLADWFHARVVDADVDQSISYLRAFRAVLAFEMNRPYARWFAREIPLKLDSQNIAAIMDLCERLRADEEAGGLADELDRYLLSAGVKEAAIRDARGRATGSNTIRTV
jgi:hypothetical protein